MVLGIAGTILVFGAIVFIHELGHYLVARWSGMGILEFSMGFGPALLKWQRGDTLYAIRAVPLGGYVRIAGMALDDEAEDPPNGFNKKSFPAKFATIFAGSAMNFVLAFIVLVILGVAVGYPKETGLIKIGNVVAASPAQQAGIKTGDVIVSIGGTKPQTSEEASKLIRSTTPPVELVVERAGKELTFQVTPKPMKDAPHPIIGVGLAAEVIYEQVGIGESMRVGVEKVAQSTVMMLKGLGQLVTGKVGLNGVMGPLGIMGITYEASSQAAQSREAMAQFLVLFALISMNIGLINLMPIPALDGSRLIFTIIEAIRGKPVDKQKEAMVHFVGMVLLLTLIAVVSINDVSRILPWGK